jgi:ribosome-associated protein
MIADSNALAEFIALHPQTDIQQLRTLVRNAQKELAADKPPKSSREIFKLLREVTEASQKETSGDLDETQTDEPNNH